MAAPSGVSAAATAPATMLQVPADCTARNLMVTLAGSKADPANASTLSITLMAIDSDPTIPSNTPLTCTVTNPASPSMTTCSDMTHQVPLQAGMLIGLSLGSFTTQGQINAFLPSTVYASFTCN